MSSVKHFRGRQRGLVIGAVVCTLATSLASRFAFVTQGGLPRLTGVFPATLRGAKGYERLASTTRYIGEGQRAAHIAVVNVDVTPGGEEQFIEASMDNARKSIREESNQRFDILRSVDDPTKFTLIEIYRKETGPVDHKSTAHYLTWRETVADLMATPRSASQWDTIYPQFASGFQPEALILERFPPDVFGIEHEYVTLGEVAWEPFKELSLGYAKFSMREDKSMRVDVLKGLGEDSDKILIIRVFRSIRALEDHKKVTTYLGWKVGRDKMSINHEIKRYENIFPSLAKGWTGVGDTGQAGGKNWGG